MAMKVAQAPRGSGGDGNGHGPGDGEELVELNRGAKTMERTWIL